MFRELTAELLELEATELGVGDALYAANLTLCCCASCTCTR